MMRKKSHRTFASFTLFLASFFVVAAAALIAGAEPQVRPVPLEASQLRAEIRLSGDGPILEALEKEGSDASGERLHAIRASTELRTPALAIPALARLSGTREAFEAEAALYAAASIIHHLEEDFIARDELDIAEFIDAAERLAALGEDALIPRSFRSRAAIAALELRDRLGQ